MTEDFTSGGDSVPGRGTLYDLTAARLADVPDTITTKATTIETLTVVKQLTQTHVVRTVRQREVGDFIFIQYVGPERSFRLVLPPEVAAAIARQRDQLTTKVRKAIGRRQAAERAARGEAPAFLKAKRKKKAKRSSGEQS